MNPNIFSDLRKPGLVPGESLSLSTKINSVLEKYLSYRINLISTQAFTRSSTLASSDVRKMFILPTSWNCVGKFYS